MPIFLDGHGVFAAIGAKPEAFPDIKADVLATAEKLLIKQIKRATTLDRLGVVFSAVGRDNAKNVLDAMKDTEVSALVKKLDKVRAPELDAPAGRAHLVALGFGDVAPEAPKAKAKAPKAKKVQKSLLEATSAFAEAHVRAAPPAASEEKKAPAKSGSRRGQKS